LSEAIDHGLFVEHSQANILRNQLRLLCPAVRERLPHGAQQRPASPPARPACGFATSWHGRQARHHGREWEKGWDWHRPKRQVGKP